MNAARAQPISTRSAHPDEVKHVHVRLYTEEYRALKKRVVDTDMKLGEYLRQAVLRDLGIAGPSGA